MVCDERALTIAGAANGATMAPARSAVAWRLLNPVMANSPGIPVVGCLQSKS
jgi:hypothetical protein